MPSDSDTRIEQDSMGEMQVPANALWGASTQRAVENFPISGRYIPANVIHAFGLLKAAAANENAELQLLTTDLADPIIKAASEVAAGEHDDHFPVDIYQTGSGTSTNMNANEVIANRANQILGHPIGSKGKDGAVHPNDHVNMGQSSNDTFPTAMNVAAGQAIHKQLIPALKDMYAVLTKHTSDWDHIVKIGRTHLMDATPIRVGQVFSGYATQIKYALQRAESALDNLKELSIGGTAVGTGINTHPDFAKRVAQQLAIDTGIEFREADNHPESQATKDGFVQAHANLKTIAVSLSKIANDIRWLGSGPRCGLGELQLPATQPGSSIMPGKVNPVMCESVIQLAVRVAANDAAVTLGGFGGVGSLLELNVAMPMMADAMIESITLLANGTRVFTDRLLKGLQVNTNRCRDLIDQSLMMVTSLAPKIGYDTAAGLAKTAFKDNKTIRELALEQNLLPEDDLNNLLDPDQMTRPTSSK